jgi:hypothetical protein
MTPAWWDPVAGGSQPAKQPLAALENTALSREKGPKAVSLGSVVGTKAKCALLMCGRTFTTRRRGQRYCGRRCRQLARTWAVRDAA